MPSLISLCKAVSHFSEVILCEEELITEDVCQPTSATPLAVITTRPHSHFLGSQISPLGITVGLKCVNTSARSEESLATPSDEAAAQV